MMRNNNPLNLFPTTQTSAAAQLKLQRLLYSTLNRGPTQIQSTIASTLFNDQIDYMSTLDMNRAASFTFGYQNNIDTTTGHGGESVANELWELVLDAVLCRPTEHSILALTKTISLLEHVLVNGAERVCLDGELLYRIEMVVGPLRELNTALVEQQLIEQILTTNNSDDNTSNDNGRARGNNDVVLIANGIGEQLTNFSTKAAATMLKLRGGSIDKGHPVRMAADKLYTLVSNPNNLRQVRLEKASSSNTTSLVPIGSANKAGFITDEGRYRLLQQKMAREEKEQQAAKRKEHQQTRSNLIGPASTDGFGGGYSGANGSTKTQVVGAAHSLEDMIKSAKFELEQHKNKRAEQIASLKKGYSDNPHEVARKLQELERNDVTRDPKFIEKERGLQQALEYLEELQREQQEKEEEENVGDLLGGGDFFGGNTNAVNGGLNHSQAFGGGSEDLLGFQSNVSQVPVSSSQPDVFGASSSGGTTEDLLGFDGFAGPSPQQPQHQQQHRQIQQQQQQQYQMEDEQQLQGGRPVAVKWQKRHSAVHHLSMRMLNWARSITSNADACRRQKDVVVVPAHVMRSMMSQSVAASGIGGEQTGMGGEGGPIGAAIAAEASAAPTPGGINVTRPSVSGAPKGLQDVLEETPSTEANDGERERKRTESSESTSGGMGSSQYV
mmetsp:Transcript_19202/g.29311  ORF Transcript_19202/g.29311 Transcript_19202/m.29311 type:complete len:668 (+) Transcript_19202:213-2216(+)